MSQPAATVPAHFAGVSSQQETGAPVNRLVMSDYLFLGGIALALFIVDDPLDQYLQENPLLRHLPLILSLLSILLASVGDLLRQPATKSTRSLSSWPIVRTAFPFLILAAWIIVGSLYARAISGIQDTFLNTGIYMMLSLLTARGVLLSPARVTLIRFAVRIMTISAAYMILRMIVDMNLGGGRYHEMEFVVTPTAVYFALKPSISAAWRRVSVGFFIAGGVVFCKNTGFIVMLLTLAYLLAADWRTQLRKPARLYSVIVAGAASMALALCAVMVFGPELSGISLPNGNPGYRVRAYQKAIERFEASPVAGVLFADRSTTQFTAFHVDAIHPDNQLPTHSDILDLAANGGVAALILLIWGYTRIGRLFWRVARRRDNATADDAEALAAAHMFTCISLAGISVYAVNPVLLQPDKGMMIWLSLGMLLGISLYQPRHRLSSTECAQ